MIKSKVKKSNLIVRPAFEIGLDSSGKMESMLYVGNLKGMNLEDLIELYDSERQHLIEYWHRSNRPTEKSG